MPLPTIHPRTLPGFAGARWPASGHVWSAAPGRWAAQQRAVLAAAVLVLLAHALLLNGWRTGPGRTQRSDGDRPLVLQRVMRAVHTVQMATAVPVQGDVGAVKADALADTGGQRRDVVAARTGDRTVSTFGPTFGVTAGARLGDKPGPDGLAAPRAAAALAPTSTPTSTPTPTSTSAAHADADTAAGAWDTPADTAQPSGLPVPTYATQLPPSTTLQFALRRGASTGRAELVWHSENGRYQLQMRGQVLAAPQLAWRSEGTLDAHGIAPDRYAEWRRGRELRAANFQRSGGGGGGSAGADANRITFSGPQAQYPLLAGAQDRISWMLQLPAVLAANPALQAPGSTVQLFVAGARGDAAVWTFTVLGTEAVTLADGSSVAGALHLQRDPARPYDTRADVWLDPTRNHLPVRALLTVRPSGDATEFVLERQPAP